MAEPIVDTTFAPMFIKAAGMASIFSGESTLVGKTTKKWKIQALKKHNYHNQKSKQFRGGAPHIQHVRGWCVAVLLPE